MRIYGRLKVDDRGIWDEYCDESCRMDGRVINRREISPSAIADTFPRSKNCSGCRIRTCSSICLNSWSKLKFWTVSRIDLWASRSYSPDICSFPACSTGLSLHCGPPGERIPGLNTHNSFCSKGMMKCPEVKPDFFRFAASARCSHLATPDIFSDYLRDRRTFQQCCTPLCFYQASNNQLLGVWKCSSNVIL